VKYLVYTDGSASVKDRTGGYAYKIVDIEPDADGDLFEFYGGGSEVDTTISRMELMAAIAALEEINDWHLDSAEDYEHEGVVLVLSDSEHVVLGFMNKNRARNKNVDLWDRLEKAAEPSQLVVFEHVKGHAGHDDNEEVDKLAGEFRQAAVESLK
jgi:ribonuclease HI